MVVSRGTWRLRRESRLTQSCSRGRKLRLTFWLGNYIRSFPYTFGSPMKSLGTLRPGFYPEFRCKSYEHSGLAWEAILKKSACFDFNSRVTIFIFPGTCSKNRLSRKCPRQLWIWTVRFIYGLSSRNGLTDDLYMDFLPKIYGPYNQHMFLQENLDHTVHIGPLEGKRIDRRFRILKCWRTFQKIENNSQWSYLHFPCVTNSKSRKKHLNPVVVMGRGISNKYP